MPLDKYPFSERYGWLQDKYGLSWQLILSNPEGEERPFIVPSLMFVGKVCGKAEESTNFYMSVFKNSRRGIVAHYPKGMEPDKEGTIMFTDFMIENQWFAAMDSARAHNFAFNEATSFMVYCDGAVRLAQGQVRSLVADRPDHDGRDDGKRHARTDRPPHASVPADEKTRYRRIRKGI